MLCIGKSAIIFTNELIIPTCIIVWYFTHYLGKLVITEKSVMFIYTFKLAYDLLIGGCSLMNIGPCKLVWTVFDALFRSHGICNIVWSI